MKIGFFPRYDRLGASSRHRFFNYFERWQKGMDESCQLAIYPGLSDCYLQKLYHNGKVGKLTQAWELAKLFKRACLIRCDAMVIEYELMIGLPYKYEAALIGKRPYILNFDDNVWTKYCDKPFLLDKYDELCRSAAGVIAGNAFLQEKIAPLNKNICVIPTAVELTDYQTNFNKFDQFTLAWIGTPVTYKYLELHAELLSKITCQCDCELLVVADRRLGQQRPLPGVRARYVDWSPELEVEYLKKSHIGIMPLTDDEFSRGKSAFKLLQYQAAGLPWVASPVGENNLVGANLNGRLPRNESEWLQMIGKLRYDRVFYQQCAAESLVRAQDYSLEKYFPIYRDFILKAFGC